jgi:hypothetical protein
MHAQYDPGKPLVSIHVPKTGGASVQEVLRGWFRETGFFSHYADEPNGGAPKRHVLAPGTCVHGHFNKYRGYGLRDYYPDADQWIMFLRDPFEQHVSLYFYLRRLGGSYRFAGRAVPTDVWGSFDAFLGFLSDNRDALQNSFANTFLAHLPIELDNAADGDAAFASFVHVGTTDRLEASLKLLAAKLGRAPPGIPHLNAAKRDLPVDANLRSRHECLFPLEHALYEVARARHADEIAAIR